MAEILPFRALHYRQPSELSALVTQPYDKISPAMQADYYHLSPHNLVRIIRGQTLPQDSPADNVYTRAAHDFADWRAAGVLGSEATPAIYPYFQGFEVPGQAGGRKERRGFIALLRLEDYSARVVHRHEQTLSGPKADRLELLKATRAHFGQIFFLYSDPAGEIEHLVATATAEQPWEQVKDEYDTLHTVWRVADPAVIAQVAEAMRAKPLVIADGHHRYETALAYRNHARAQGGGDGRVDFVMGTLVRMETAGLTILPTHRLVHGLAHFDWAEFLASAPPMFDVQRIEVRTPARASVADFLANLAASGNSQLALGAYAGKGEFTLLRLRGDIDLDQALAAVPPTLRRLDVVVLHRLVLERLLGIGEQAVREEANLTYMREASTACDQVESGAQQIAFLLNPTPVSAVYASALADCPMPQKSTDFYPKLLSGLTIYWLDNPAGI